MADTLLKGIVMYNLFAIFDTFQDKGHPVNKWLHYLPIYERFFSRFQNQSIQILEIGVGYGGSLKMWRSYFGANCRVIGVDIRPSCKSYESELIDVRIGSQSDTSFLKSLVDEYKNFDIVVDDGSHRITDIMSSVSYLYRHLSNNGVYLIEDLSIPDNMPIGGVPVINHFLSLSDQERSAALPDLDSISLFRGVLVFEKRYVPLIKPTERPSGADVWIEGRSRND